MTQVRQLVSVVLLVTFVSLSQLGCGGNGLRRNHIEGQVTFQGSPVPRGVIRFTPDREKGNTGPGAVAQIKDGYYETPSGRGVVAGPHTVMIAGFDGIAVAEGAWEGEPLFEPYLTTWDFPNKSSVVDFEVPAEPIKQGRKPSSK